MKSQQNPGSIPIPTCDEIKVENPDGVYLTYGDADLRHSAYDAFYLGNGRSLGPFARDDGMFAPDVETTDRSKRKQRYNFEPD